MANHYFGINDFELVKAMHEDGFDITMEGLGPWGDKDGSIELPLPKILTRECRFSSSRNPAKAALIPQRLPK